MSFIIFFALSMVTSQFCSADFNSAISTLEQSMAYSPFPQDRNHWAEAAQKLRSQESSRQLSRAEIARLELLDRKIQAMQSLADCLPSGAQDLGRSLAIGLSSSMSCVSTPMTRSSDFNIRSSGHGIEATALIDLALAEINVAALKRSYSIAKSYGGEKQFEDFGKVFQKICGWSESHPRRGPVCRDKKTAGNILDSIKKADHTNSISLANTNKKLQEVVTKLQKDYHRIPFNEKLRDHRDISQSQIEYLNYLSAIQSETLDPANAILLQEPIRSRFNTVNLPTENLLPANGPQLSGNPLTLDERNEAAIGAIDSALFFAKQANQLIESTYGPPNYHLAQLVGTYPQIFGQIILEHPNSSKLVCHAIKEFQENRVLQEKALQTLQKVSQQSNLATGSVATAACLSTLIFPPLGSTCAVSSMLTSLSGTVGMAKPTYDLLMAQNNLNHITNSMTMGYPSPSLSEAIESRRVVSEVTSQLIESGMTNAAYAIGGGALAQLARIRTPSIAVIKEIQNNLERILKPLAARLEPKEKDTLMSFLFSLRENGQWKKLAPFLEEALQNPGKFQRLKALLGEVDKEMSACML